MGCASLLRRRTSLLPRQLPAPFLFVERRQRNGFAEALELAAKTVTQPIFPEGEFTRVRNEALAGAVQRRSTVEGLAAEAFSRALFAPTAAYSRQAAGTAETAPATTTAARGSVSVRRTPRALPGDGRADDERMRAPFPGSWPESDEG